MATNPLAPSSFSINRYQTVVDSINAICGMVGYLPTTDPVGSQDPKILQMVACLNMSATELMSKYPWQELTKEYSLDVFALLIDDGTDTFYQKEAQYPLPDDFFELVDMTLNDSTNKFMLSNPLMNRQWQWYKNAGSAPQTLLQWRIVGNHMCFLNPPSEPTTVRFEYQSLAWALDQDEPTMGKNYVNKNADTFLLDGYLITQLARAKWLELNGFDSSGAMRDFQIGFDNRTGGTGAPVLMINSTGMISMNPNTHNLITG